MEETMEEPTQHVASQLSPRRDRPDGSGRRNWVEQRRREGRGGAAVERTDSREARGLHEFQRLAIARKNRGLTPCG